MNRQTSITNFITRHSSTFSPTNFYYVRPLLLVFSFATVCSQIIRWCLFKLYTCIYFVSPIVRLRMDLTFVHLHNQCLSRELNASTNRLCGRSGDSTARIWNVGNGTGDGLPLILKDPDTAPPRKRSNNTRTNSAGGSRCTPSLYSTYSRI